jgi:hypothetical protein
VLLEANFDQCKNSKFSFKRASSSIFFTFREAALNMLEQTHAFKLDPLMNLLEGMTALINI